jgi:probable phosphoglycerate mutase
MIVGIPSELGRHEMTTIVLVRHGQTEWNRVERFRGRADVPLNEAGIAQAAATGERVAKEYRPAAIYASPLSRALRTAEAIAQHFGLVVRPHAGLLDIDYGDWQGLTPDEARQRWPDPVHAWYTTPDLARIPGGESLDALRARAMDALRELASQHTEETVVLVAHTVVNRIILLGILGLGNDRFWRLRQDPCAINVFESDGQDYTLVSMNDTCHLRASDPKETVA